MQAVGLFLMWGMSLCGVFGSDPDTLSIIRAIKALQTKVETLETSQAQVQTKVETLETSQAQVQTKVRTLESSRVQVQNQVQTLQSNVVQLQNTPRVAFHAGFYDGIRTRHYGPFDTDTTLKYTKVLTNIGNGYNSETGVFTAPVRGVYVFHITMYSLWGISSESAHIYLKKNTDVLLYINERVSVEDLLDSGSGVVVVTLEQGDTVSAELESNKSFYDSNGKDTTFSGFLLSALAPPPQ